MVSSRNRRSKPVLRAQCQHGIWSHHKFVWWFDFYSFLALLAVHQVLSIVVLTKAYTRLCSGKLCMLRHIESYLESDSFALNQKDVILIFLKNLFGTKCTVSVKFDTIIFVDTISFFIFFSLLPQLSTFIFDKKTKIECEGDQYIIEN